MRKFIRFCLVLFCLATLPIGQISAAIMPIEPIAQTSEYKNAEARQIQQQLRQNRKEIRKALKSNRPSNTTDAETVLLVILAILLPPLAVLLLYNGITLDFWITLLLTLFLFWIGGIIYALYVILAK
jgi:uncharacterized membrane protein YqaE (UPF0057 family)